MNPMLKTPDVGRERRETRSSTKKRSQLKKQGLEGAGKPPKNEGEQTPGVHKNTQDVNKVVSQEVLQFDNGPDSQSFQPSDSVMMGQVCQFLSGAGLNAECDAVPLGRRKEFDVVRGILEDSFRAGKGAAVYICGLPGTGKTMTVNRVVGSMKQQYSCTEEHAPVFVNFTCCGAGSNVGGLFGMVFRQYMRSCNQDASQQQYSQDDLEASSISEQEHYNFLEKLVTSKPSNNKRSRRSSIGSQSKSRRRSSICSQTLATKSYGMIVLVMDEIDFVVQKDAEQLQQLIALCFKESSRLVIIGISNQLDLPDKHLAQFKSSLQTIQFSAYSDHIMMEKILQQRLFGLPWQVIDSGALSFICREVCNNSGDMRMALKMMQSAVESLPETPYNIVNIVVAMGAVQKCMDKQHCQTIEIIQNLPQQQQILIACLVKLTIEQEIQISQNKQSRKRRRITIGKCVKKGAFTQRWIPMQHLHKCFEIESQKMQIGNMSFSMVKQVCEAIQDGANLVRIKGSTIDTFRVALATDIDVIKHSFKDCVLISKIYQQ